MAGIIAKLLKLSETIQPLNDRDISNLDDTGTIKGKVHHRMEVSLLNPHDGSG